MNVDFYKNGIRLSTLEFNIYKCPICGNNDHVLLSLENMSRDNWLGRRYWIDGYFQCPKCKFIITNYYEDNESECIRQLKNKWSTKCSEEAYKRYDHHLEVYNPETGKWEEPEYWEAPKDYFYKVYYKVYDRVYDLFKELKELKKNTTRLTMILHEETTYKTLFGEFKTGDKVEASNGFTFDYSTEGEFIRYNPHSDYPYIINVNGSYRDFNLCRHKA